MTAACPDAFVTFATGLAEASGEILRGYFRRPLAVERKSDASPVTLADRATEEKLRALIADRFADHGVVGEEFPAHRPEAEYVWVIDPIDGTRSFISGVPIFGTLIALLHRGAPILGIIDQPILRERWIGARGRPTLFNGQPATVRPCDALQRASLHATTPDMFTGANSEAFARLRAAVSRPLYGWDCYAYAQLASGHIDLIAEADLKPYDFCALAPVIEGAGGIISDWSGRPLGLVSDGRILAAGDPARHREALALLASA